MHLVDLLRELRLLKGQEGYRYCLAWLVVLFHIGAKPLVTIFLFWLAVSNGLDLRVTRAFLSILP